MPAVITVTSGGTAPAGWDAWLDGVAATDFAASAWWNDAAARYYPHAAQRWWAAHREGALVGGLVALSRRRHGFDRLESGLEGSPAGPQVSDDLTPAERRRVAGALLDACGASVRGRTITAAVTLSAAQSALVPAASGWQREDVATAVIDLSGGLAHIERTVLSNNRRNERNRGLKRGCTLHTSTDPDDVAAWYAIYLDVAASWAQAPVPLEFMQALLRERSQHAFFALVRRRGVIVGGHFCIAWRDRVAALYGASRPDLAREVFPSTLLYWQDIVEGCARGARVLDFGGYAGRTGLRQFKRLMGAAEEVRCQLRRSHPLWTVAAAMRRTLRGGP